MASLHPEAARWRQRVVTYTGDNRISLFTGMCDYSVTQAIPNQQCVLKSTRAMFSIHNHQSSYIVGVYATIGWMDCMLYLFII